MSVVVPVPTFVTLSVYVAGEPTTNAPTAALTMRRSGVALTGTAPVVPLLSVVTVSPGVLARAVFTTDGSAAAATLTLSVSVLESLPAIAPDCVHATTCPVAAQLHPVPLALV